MRFNSKYVWFFIHLDISRTDTLNRKLDSLFDIVLCGHYVFTFYCQVRRDAMSDSDGDWFILKSERDRNSVY